jgi:uncharacterized protein
VTLYLDTSALIKIYLAEAGSAEVAAAVEAASAVATSSIAYAELRAAFARARREKRVDEPGHTALTAELDAHWPRYAVVTLDDARLRDAGGLADRHSVHALRALDSIHLAGAVRLALGNPSSIMFGCWDIRLWRAARDEAFTMFPEAEPD